MSGKSANTIVDEVKGHIAKQGGSPKEWYVGITESLKNRLQGDHGVPEENHWFITRTATSSGEARQAEMILLAWGCTGGPGGGDDDAIHVYAYLMTSGTRP